MNSPNTVHFGIGGFNGPCWDVELKTGALVVRETRAGYVEGKETLVTPTVEAWSRFWQAVENTGVWQWQSRYFSEVLDGTQWELELAHAGRTLRCDGSNAYPAHNDPDYDESPQFMQFLAALRTLTGLENIG